MTAEYPVFPILLIFPNLSTTRVFLGSINIRRALKKQVLPILISSGRVADFRGERSVMAELKCGHSKEGGPLGGVGQGGVGRVEPLGTGSRADSLGGMEQGSGVDSGGDSGKVSSWNLNLPLTGHPYIQQHPQQPLKIHHGRGALLYNKH